MAQEMSTTSLGPFFAFLIIRRCICRLRLLFCPVLVVPLIVHCCHHFGHVVVVVHLRLCPCRRLVVVVLLVEFLAVGVRPLIPTVVVVVVCPLVVSVGVVL